MNFNAENVLIGTATIAYKYFSLIKMVCPVCRKLFVVELHVQLQHTFDILTLQIYTQLILWCTPLIISQSWRL